MSRKRIGMCWKVVGAHVAVITAAGWATVGCSADLGDGADEDLIPCATDDDCLGTDVCDPQGYCRIPLAERANFGSQQAGADGSARAPDAGSSDPTEANSSDVVGSQSPDSGNGVATDSGSTAGSSDAGSAGCTTNADCDDGLTCTTDTCEAGVCVVAVHKNYCAIDGACVMATTDGPKPCTVCNPNVDAKKWVANVGSTCDDGLACTLQDACTAKGSCEGVATEGCCEKDADCVASGACKTGICDIAKMTCSFFDVPGCCTQDSECDGAKSACAAPGCDQKTNKCALIPAPQGQACDDGNACTKNDGCSGGVCKGGQGCDDGNPCTADMCAAGTCVHSPVANCCAAGACCDVAKLTFKPKGSTCGNVAAAKEHKCLGPMLMVREAMHGCTGTAAACSLAKADWAWTAWKKDKNCGAMATCKVDAKGARCEPKPPPKGDLLVAALKTDKASYGAGDAISVTATLLNQSAGPAGAHTLQVRLSKDAKWSGNDVKLATSKRTKLKAGGVDVAVVSGKLPTKLAAGTWHVLARADVNGAVSELNEGNNSKHVAFGVLPPPPPKRADLVAAWFKPMAASSVPGGSIGLLLEVHNAGTKASGAFKVDFRLSKDKKITGSDIGLGSISVAGLKIGEKRPVAFTAKLPSKLALGSWHIGTRIDASGHVKELSESNNVGKHALTVNAPPKPPPPTKPPPTKPPPKVIPKPDLRVVSVVASKGSKATVGAKTAMTIAVKNVGKATSKAFRVAVMLSEDAVLDGKDHTLASHDVAGLKPGATSSFTVTPTIPMAAKPGTWVVGALADSLQAVTESDETNNVSLALLSLQAAPPPPKPPPAPPKPPPAAPKPDLTASYFMTPAGSYSAGGSIGVMAIVRNVGVGTAGISQVRVLLSADKSLDKDDQQIAAWKVGTLSASTEHARADSGVLPAKMALGTWYLLLIVDADNEVAESSEANNVRIVSFSIAN